MAGDLDILSWRAAVAKGKKLYALMRMSSDEASRELDTPSQSKFHSFEDLKAYGWTESDPNGYHLSNLKIDNVLSDIIGERQLDLRKMEVKQFEHDGQFVKNYVTYPPTTGKCINVYDPKNDFLGAWSNYGPGYEQRYKTNAVLPDLKHWSDVNYLAWGHYSRLAGVLIKAPRWILRIGVLSTSVHSIGDYALQSLTSHHPAQRTGIMLQPFPDWPGQKFSMVSDAGKAILGTPNGKSSAWFLIQHKEQFGTMYIDEVTLFRSARRGNYMLFSVVSK